MSNYIQSKSSVVLPYAATTINLSDSGKLLVTPQTAAAVGVTYTLPAVASSAGAHFRFVNGAPAALSGSVTITAPANTLRGMVSQGPVGAPSSVSVTNSTSILFVTAASIRGDCIDIYCDGSAYYVNATTAIAVAITVAP